jgi:hypothetical protein
MRQWMIVKLLITVEMINKPNENNLDDYGDLLLLQLEKMLPNKVLSSFYREKDISENETVYL